MYNITAMVVVYNEEDWIKESILSILPYVNEVVVVDDNSTDDTVKIVKAINDCKIKLYTYNEHNIIGLGNLKNFCKDKSTNDIVIRWDADFIAYSHISELFKNVMNSKDMYNSWILSGPNLTGDIYHQPLDHIEYGPEAYIFNKHNVNFERINGFDDYPVSINIKHNYYYNKYNYWIHMNTLKSIDKLTYRIYMSKYLSNRKDYSSDYYEWVGNYLYNGLSRMETKYLLTKRIMTNPLNLIDFDFDKYGQHPEILLNSKSIHKFKLKNIDDEYYIDY